MILSPQYPLHLAVLDRSPSDGMGGTGEGRGAVLSLLKNGEHVGRRAEGTPVSLAVRHRPFEGSQTPEHWW